MQEIAKISLKKILVRLHAAESTRVLDEITRKRRLRRQLEALEQVFFNTSLFGLYVTFNFVSKVDNNWLLLFLFWCENAFEVRPELHG